MSCHIETINYCPVKSLSFQSINSCNIKKKLGKDFFSIPKGEKAENIELVRAVEIIREGLEIKSKSVIHDFGEIKVLNGRYGPYIKSGKNNYKIPKDVEPEVLDEDSCKKIIEESPPKGIKSSNYPQKFEQQLEDAKSQKI